MKIVLSTFFHRKKVSLLLLAMFGWGDIALSQVVYRNDSVTINMEYKSRQTIQSISDLNITVTYTAKNNNGVPCYNHLNAAGQSTFGNCYFRLMQLDGDQNYRDVTEETINPGHPPKDFANSEDILRYDLPKSLLGKNNDRSLTINLFDYVAGLTKGEYILIFFLRVGNNFGTNSNGELVTNSLMYLESTPLIFEVPRNMSRF